MISRKTALSHLFACVPGSKTGFFVTSFFVCFREQSRFLRERAVRKIHLPQDPLEHLPWDSLGYWLLQDPLGHLLQNPFGHLRQGLLIYIRQHSLRPMQVLRMRNPSGTVSIRSRRDAASRNNYVRDGPIFPGWPSECRHGRR